MRASPNLPWNYRRGLIIESISLFYSWQSDRPRKLGRDIILNAANAAIEGLVDSSAIYESPRIELTSDTTGQAGTPTITDTIFGRIERAAIFLADVTFIGKSDTSEARPEAKQLPNPNVLLELGYAAGRIGWDRIVLVMNTAFGEPQDLIFDLRNRRFPIQFCCTDGKTFSEKHSQRLVGDLRLAIQASLATEHMAASRAVDRLSKNAISVMKRFGCQPYFSIADGQHLGEDWTLQKLDDAAARLIDLGLLRCDVSGTADLFAYHWTYIGKLVLKKYGLWQIPVPTSGSISCDSDFVQVVSTPLPGEREKQRPD